jgi:hypothetical protein
MAGLKVKIERERLGSNWCVWQSASKYDRGAKTRGGGDVRIVVALRRNRQIRASCKPVWGLDCSAPPFHLSPSIVDVAEAS